MKKQRYISKGRIGLFDRDCTEIHLSKIGNPLERLNKVIDFEIFRETLETGLFKAVRKTTAGAPRFDPVTMFKILILQRYYGLSDKQVEYQITDRLSFKNFLSLESGDKIPDEKTIWAFREKLSESGLTEKIFENFKGVLREKGLILDKGSIIDASFVNAPRQRNTREENKKIKDGEGEKLWQDEPNKKRHKDIDARWTKKNNETYYGYKNHVKVDTKSKLVTDYEVTGASVHDSQVLDKLFGQKDEGKPLYADSAYSGEPQKQIMEKNKVKNRVHEKGARNKPLNQRQKELNRRKSRVRARVEHVFGFMEQSMKGLKLDCVGKKRAEAVVGLINLTYNMFRYEQIVRM